MPNDKKINVRVSDILYLDIVEMAKKSGLGFSEYVRFAVMTCNNIVRKEKKEKGQ